MALIKLSNSWLPFLAEELKKPYFQQLELFLEQEVKNQKTIYPETQNYFRALDLVSPSKVKVVILGQDPYHSEGQAHGLCFSVPTGVLLPPSLVNIYKERKSDIGVQISDIGDLTPWAEQGVLLLNSVLTVEKDRAASHQKQGWETFTDKIISVINENCEHVVFILWGAYAQKKAAFVDHKKHLVLECVHPSPLSSYRGFFGSKPFSKSNAWLESHKITPVKW